MKSHLFEDEEFKVGDKIEYKLLHTSKPSSGVITRIDGEKIFVNGKHVRSIIHKNNIIKKINQRVKESRPTNSMGILQDIKSKFEKVLSLNYTANSLVAIFRYKDGNAYMVEITPAAYMNKSKIGNIDKFIKKK